MPREDRDTTVTWVAAHNANNGGRVNWQLINSGDWSWQIPENPMEKSVHLTREAVVKEFITLLEENLIPENGYHRIVWAKDGQIYPQNDYCINCVWSPQFECPKGHITYTIGPLKFSDQPNIQIGEEVAVAWINRTSLTIAHCIIRTYRVGWDGLLPHSLDLYTMHSETVDMSEAIRTQEVPA